MKTRSLNLTNTLTAAAGIAILLPLLGLGACAKGAKSIAGHYANTSNTTAYIDLSPDGKWLAQGQSGWSVIQQTGTYHETGGTVVFELMGAATTASISGTTLVVPAHDPWVVPPGTFTKQNR